MKAPADDDDGPESDRPMTLFEHLEELRRRVFWAVVVAAIGVAVCAFFQAELFAVALAPVHGVLARHAAETGGELIFTEVSEPLFTGLKLILVAGLFFTGPAVLYLLWGFVSTGLYPHEKRSIRVFAPVSYLLFIGGCVFFYFVIQPIALEALITYPPEMHTLDGGRIRVSAKLSLQSTVSFFLTMTVIMGLIFELPLVMMFLQKIRVVTWRTFSKYRRHFLIGALVLSAVITPTGDAFTLGLFMIPIVVLFEGGILVCRLTA